jgi:hypothetical protein
LGSFDQCNIFADPVISDRLNIGAFGLSNRLEEGNEVAFEIDGQRKFGFGMVELATLPLRKVVGFFYKRPVWYGCVSDRLALGKNVMPEPTSVERLTRFYRS